MAPKQENPHDSLTTNGGFKRTDTEPSDDHWAFLEDFEAPMWVDFELEAQSMNHGRDDDWFESVHPVHQCSSRDLKSRFSKGKGNSVDSICSSPKLPDSVSRSRGKHYKTKKWVGGMNIASQAKQLKARTELLQHPIRNLCRKKLVSKSTNRVCHGADGIHNNSMSTVTSKLSIKPKTSSGGSRKTSNSQEGSTTETNQRSMTSTQRSGLLSTMRISLSKISIANSEPILEIKNGGMFRDRKSSSSKSSIGSSSNPRRNGNSITSKSSVGSSSSGYNGNSISRLRNAGTLESRKESIFASSASFKGKDSNMLKQPVGQILDGNSNSKKGGKTIAATDFSRGSKTKLLDMPFSRKSVLSLNIADPLLGKPAKSNQNVGSSKLKGVPAGGKENIVGGMVRNQKASGNVGGCIQNIPERKPRNTTQAIYIR